MNGPTLLSLTHELNRCRERAAELGEEARKNFDWAKAERRGRKQAEAALRDAVDVAIWLTGVADLAEVEGWPAMRAKLGETIMVARRGVPRSASEQEETDG